MAQPDRVVVPISERLRKSKEAVMNLEEQINQERELLNAVRVCVGLRNFVDEEGKRAMSDTEIIDALETIL